MKVAPVIDALGGDRPSLGTFLLHTGQHYDEAMKDTFFRELGIPEPDVDLEVGSGTHAEQTAQIMLRFEPVLDRVRPAAVLVVGDVNSTIACALVAAKREIPIVHVEAGLRSYDRTMPEEINRVLTDQLSDLLFTTEEDALQNLTREGIDPRRVHFVGNVMIDTLRRNLHRAVPPNATIARYRRQSGSLSESLERFGVVTLHRPSNVDDERVLHRLLDVLAGLSRRLPLVFPMHPRTEARVRATREDFFHEHAIVVTPPLSYLEMLGLVSGATVVLTDSGGLQEETTALGVACVTLRENTERPITETEGTNTVVGTDPDRIRAVVRDVLETGGKSGRVPRLWDGNAALRIKDVLVSWLSQNERSRVAV
jgi:UDP-N-acetylglucosamine 2-epimerase (non-hydrolysing)